MVLAPISLTTNSLTKEKLASYLNLLYGGDVCDLLDSALIHPVHDLTDRPSKKIRSRLLEFGFNLAQTLNNKQGESHDCAELKKAIEYLHSGSLAVDDVQDGSKRRRGKLTLHLRYGLPLALNAGNWLYYWPLELIRECALNPTKEMQVYRWWNRTLMRAHVGQALDLGIRLEDLDQRRIPEVCLSVLELKTGALFSLALVLGGILGDADEKDLDTFSEFGHGWGIGLQMFDDIGNLTGGFDPGKKYEDLLLKRPSYIWAMAAQISTANEYAEFLEAVSTLPREEKIQAWCGRHKLGSHARTEAIRHTDACFKKFQSAVGRNAQALSVLQQIKSIGTELSRSFENKE